MGISKLFRRVGARPLSRYSVGRKGVDTLPVAPSEPKPMVIKSRLAKNLAKKAKKAQRRNSSRVVSGKANRRYLASIQGVK
jgi:hypothetical protein